ncbi:MAG: GlsB/YeaQ/YmgE family stress response membrane protein [Planctomycetales bacterium]
MSIGSIVVWIFCGMLVGLCARLLVPGRQHMSLTMTTLLGVAGALVGGFLYSLVRGASVAPFSLASHNWYGWIVAILGAMLLVWVYPYIYPRRWWN